MFNAGLPITQGLGILATQQQNKSFAEALNNIRKDVEGGANFSNALKNYPKIFDDPVKAGDYFNRLRKNNSRYIRDQLQLIKTVTRTYSMELVNQALDFCTINNIYKATDFKSVVIKLQADKNNPQEQEQPIVVKTLDKSSFKIIPQKSSISNYQNLMG